MKELSMLKTYLEAIYDDEHQKAGSSVVVILLINILKLRILQHMEGENMPQG
jgi:hypothetical protein